MLASCRYAFVSLLCTSGSCDKFWTRSQFVAEVLSCIIVVIIQAYLQYRGSSSALTRPAVGLSQSLVPPSHHPTVWNSLPDFIRDPTNSADCFRCLLTLRRTPGSWSFGEHRLLLAPEISRSSVLSSGTRYLQICESRHCLRRRLPDT